MVKVLRMHTIQEIYENKAAAEVLVNHCRCHTLLLLEAEYVMQHVTEICLLTHSD